MQSHLQNLTLSQIIRGGILLVVILAFLFMLTSNLGIVAAGGAAVIIAHLIFASGVLYWFGQRFVRFIIQLYQQPSEESISNRELKQFE